MLLFASKLHLNLLLICISESIRRQPIFGQHIRADWC